MNDKFRVVQKVITILVIGIIFLTSCKPRTTSQNLLTVYFLDVGQGDSILIDQGDTEVLIDGGGSSPGIISLLERHVNGCLESIVVTHAHSDHIGGLTAVLNNFNIEQIWHSGDTVTSGSYSDFMAAVNEENTEIHTGKRGDIIIIDNLSFQILSPESLSGTSNNNSLVLSLSYGNIDFLFTGDAEEEAEEAMLIASDIPVPDVEVLKVGHHGSSTASSIDFLNIVNPETAIYMAGEDNQYKHPHRETLDRLAQIGADIYGTDVNGTIEIDTDGKSYRVKIDKQGMPKAGA